MEKAFAKIIESVGEDVHRQGLKDTPKRAAKAFEFLTQGYRQSLDEIVNNALFESECSEMVVVNNIELYSMCEHHLLPFIGVAHVGYLPRGKIVGLSKLARVVEEVSRRPQVQERMTHQVADLLQTELDPKGVIVVIEASHSCMTIRGIRKPGSLTITSAVRGLFKTNTSSRAEVMSLISGPRPAAQ